MIRIRRSEERGHANHGWLQSAHTFSFSGYYDLDHMGFRSLRVINEDRVAPRGGFPTHGHRDMEIVSYVLAGSLEHEDSMGNGSVIQPGDVQRMSAGSGVMHSEYNPSKSQEVRFLQIWITPQKKGITPSYEQRNFPVEERRGTLRLLASPDGADGSVTLHQDAKLYGALLDRGERVEHSLAEARHAWVQVTRGEIAVNGETLRAGDGAAISDERRVVLEGRADSELILFDLA